MARLKYTAEALAYYQAYALMSQLPEQQNRPALDRVRELVYAVADPTCPLHCHIERGIPLSVKDVEELAGVGYSVARDAMLRFSGPLGLLRQRGDQVRLRPAILSDEEIETLLRLRLQLEADALVRVHRLGSRCEKQKALHALKRCALAFDEVNDFVRDYRPDAIARDIAKDPGVGTWAEQFWRNDRDFHMAASQALGLESTAEMLRSLLQRSRLRAANRATILVRVPSSIEQHRSIIKAVEAAPSSTSDRQIVAAVADHLASSNRDFGLGESQFAENQISNEKASACVH